MLYLKPNVAPQPLFMRWYAWPYIISPACAAKNVVGRHIKIMKSYIQAPLIHAAAVKNPKMAGGPFMDLGGGRIDEVEDLLRATRDQQAHLIELAEAIDALTRLLLKEAGGYGLEQLYPKIPDPLRGYVELVYDLNNRPAIRFLEPLLYHSPYYDESFQSIALSLIEDDHRPFALSTPLLPGPDTVDLAIPFGHEGLDALFRMRYEPQSFAHITARLPVNDADLPLFRTFFTEEKPTERPAYTGDGLRMRYFGHACVLLETAETSILVDPVISYDVPNQLARFTHADLPEVLDYVLITHNHLDHVLLETLLQLRSRAERIVVPRGGSGQLQDPSLKLMLERLGFRQVEELDNLQTLEFGGGSITGIPFLGEHGDLDISTKITYRVALGGRSYLFVADTNNLEPRLHDHIHRLTGDIDVLFVGMECVGAPFSWSYGPLSSGELARDMDQSRRLDGSDCAKALALVDRYGFEEVYVYALGLEPWLEYFMAVHYTPESPALVESDRFVATCHARGIHAERLFGKKETRYARSRETVATR